MALKKADEATKEVNADEAKRAEEAKALESKKEQEAKDALAKQEEADKVEAQRLKDIDDEKATAAAKAEEELKAKEVKRLELIKEEEAKVAASTRERLAQEAEVAKAAGKEPKERKLVEVESLTHSDLRQPSTGNWISGKGTAFLLDDGWLANQIAARLLKYA